MIMKVLLIFVAVFATTLAQNDINERQKRQLWDLLTLPAKIAVGTANLAIETGNGVSRAVTGRSYRSGIIILTGRGTPRVVTDALCVGLKPFVSSTVRITCPTPPDTVKILGGIDGNEWITERSGIEGLEKASHFVAEQIDEMQYRFDIDTEDIVLVGLSEGGFLSLYTALDARYKLGGIIGIITYLPFLDELEERIKSVPNSDTPVLHMNGRQDSVITMEDGKATADALRQYFDDYTWVTYNGLHGDFLIHNPLSLRKIVKWLDEKTTVRVRLCWIPFVC